MHVPIRMYAYDYCHFSPVLLAPHIHMRVIQAIHVPPLPCGVFSRHYPPSRFFREPQLLVAQVQYSVLWRNFSYVVYIVAKLGLLCV